jgi:hypothetical protein
MHDSILSYYVYCARMDIYISHGTLLTISSSGCSEANKKPSRLTTPKQRGTRAPTKPSQQENDSIILHGTHHHKLVLLNHISSVTP